MPTLTSCEYALQAFGFGGLLLYSWQLHKKLNQLTAQQTAIQTETIQQFTTLQTAVLAEVQQLKQQFSQDQLTLASTVAEHHEALFANFIEELRSTLNEAPTSEEVAIVEYDPKNPPKEDCFAGHYTDWTIKRVRRIIQHYGADFFAGKRILDLGCGYGHVGSLFSHLGATVVYSDARSHYEEEVLKRDPSGTFIPADLDNEFPFEGAFDLILNVGVLYHLSNIDTFLQRCCHATTHMVLETEVCNSNDAHQVLYTQEEGYDQAFNRTGSRPSPAYVERVLQALGCETIALTDDSCNSSFHRYDWVVDESNHFEHGLRRLWFVKTSL
jgi:2-polyprenyl-3-methyl-5-hydroxy-6-metoxy-1,4-benzoquinol methylase